VEALVRPKLQEAYEAVKRALECVHFCILIANCEVKYWGRASSKLGRGQRVIMLKQDGSVLVHRPYGYEPVNWQPPGSRLSAELKDGKLVVRAVRLRPWEELVVEVYEVHLLAHCKLRDDARFEMYGSEGDIRDLLANNPELIEKGLKRVEVERKVEGGSIDILFIDERGRLVVVEVKRGTAGAEAVIQLKKYVERLKGELGRDVRGILVAEDLARGVRGLLVREGLEFKKIDLRKLFEVSKEQGASLTHWLTRC